MPEVVPNSKFALSPDTDKSDLTSIRKDLLRRLRVNDAIKCRVETGSYETDGGVTVGTPPEQIAGLLRHLALNKYSRYVHIGRPNPVFAIINEYCQSNERPGTIFCSQPLTRTLLEYNRRTFFRSSQISYTHETFLKRLSEAIHQGDLVSIDIDDEDVNGAVGICDFVLQRGAEVVLFNISDPDYPNIARLWKASCANPLIWHEQFGQDDEKVPVIGGGIGALRLMRPAAAAPSAMTANTF